MGKTCRGCTYRDAAKCLVALVEHHVGVRYIYTYMVYSSVYTGEYKKQGTPVGDGLLSSERAVPFFLLF